MNNIPDPLPSGYQLGRYVIQAELSPARMGRVYKALDSALGTVVAINVLAPHLRNNQGESAFFDRIRRSYDVNQRKHGDNLTEIPIKDICSIDGVTAVVVAYVDGLGAALDVAED